MFDEYAQQLLDLLPKLKNLKPDECRRTLSAAYAQVVEARLHVKWNRSSVKSLSNLCSYLRRLIDALESVAIFDPLNGVEVDQQTASAAAFAAAEALSLLALLPNAKIIDITPSEDPLRHSSTYCQVEAGLLYLISGYDVNAVATVRDLPDYKVQSDSSLGAAVVQNASYLLSRIKALCNGDISSPVTGVPYTGLDEPPDLYEEIVLENRLRCYELLSESLNSYLSWLGGGDLAQFDEVIVGIKRILSATKLEAHAHYAALADINHLASLILFAVLHTSGRSVVHNVPSPETDHRDVVDSFRRYLQTRAKGDSTRFGRPFLWPSAQEFVKKCLPGPKCDAVIAMPTGSGKSFVAELAIADALTRGSVIYLAPTNSLVHQIRRDLRYSLSEFEDLDILAFLGGGEYSGGLDDLLGSSTDRFVAVMTPEKCSLALRLSRAAFADLSLCVFDECHLLNDENRGVTVDILMAQLFTAAPKMSFVLMSAMVSNPEELADWIAAARGSTATPSVVKWRPSRTLRGFVGIDQNAEEPNWDTAVKQLRAIRVTRPDRVKQVYSAPLMMLTGLAGPWSSDNHRDYRVASLPLSVEAKVEIRPRHSPKVDYGGWTNAAARVFGEALAHDGIPVIVFVLRSRHHAFSMAAQVEKSLPNALKLEEPFSPLVEALLVISRVELGVETALRELLRNGIAVHTSAMLQTEQAASEWMFTNQRAKLMFATPTLAQGLNLPAIGVVVAGTSMGGNQSQAQESDNVPGVNSREDATILNSFGRAGRPGFANQGIAVLIGDKPTGIRTAADAKDALQQNQVLGLPDASVQVQSPIEGFIDRASTAGESIFAISDVEYVLTTLLAESSVEDDAAAVLKRTFAGYRRRAVFTAEVANDVRDRIANIKEAFLSTADIPGWLNLAAAQSGVDVFRAQRFWDAYRKTGLVGHDDAGTFSVENWLAKFFEVLGELPPARIGAYLAPDLPPKRKPKKSVAKTREARTTILTKLRDACANQRTVDIVPWAAPDGWQTLWDELSALVWAFMRGEPYASLVETFLGTPDDETVDPDRGTGKPIPSIFGFIRQITEPLARDAGCFVALNEHALRSNGNDQYVLPETLQALPLCIRNGCDSLETLAWFRFGYRERACAHRLSHTFPIPTEITDDMERATWVKQTRKRWLDGDYLVEGETDGLLEAAAIVIENNFE